MLNLVSSFSDSPSFEKSQVADIVLILEDETKLHT